MKHIAAFTESENYENYPAYINISEDTDKNLVITVRSTDEDSPSKIKITKEQMIDLLDEFSASCFHD